MKRFHRWLTVVATLLLAAALGATVWLALAGKKDEAPPPEADPLRRFDALIAREEVEAPLRAPAVREAARYLDAVLARELDTDGGKRHVPPRPEVVAGARARLAVIRGEAGRAADALAEARRSGASERFERVVRCAYGGEAAPAAGTVVACAALFTANHGAASDVTVADARLRAGVWAGSRACLTAAFNAKLPDVQRHMLADAQQALRHERRWGERSGWLMIMALLAALVAGLKLHGRPAPDRAPLAAPWTTPALHAVLVRCGLYTALLSGAVVAAALLLRAPMPAVGAAMTAVLYLLGLWMMARLVFRRFGLSWLDGLRDGAARADLALTALVTFAVDHAGRAGIGLAGSLVTDPSPRWSEIPSILDQPITAAVAIEIAAIVVIGPFTEELLFRRVLFAFLRERWTPLRAALATSVVFGLLHFYSPVASLALVWAGLTYCWALHRTGSLWPGFAAHAAGNALALLASAG